MAKDLMIDEKGDFILDPETHDLMLIDGIEEIAQRIKATLEIRYGEMVNLDPQMGSDYYHFLGKNFKKDLAAADMTSAILSFVPEVQSVDHIEFDVDPNTRKLTVSFVATARIDGNNEIVEGGMNLGT